MPVLKTLHMNSSGTLFTDDSVAWLIDDLGMVASCVVTFHRLAAEAAQGEKSTTCNHPSSFRFLLCPAVRTRLEDDASALTRSRFAAMAPPSHTIRVPLPQYAICHHDSDSFVPLRRTRSPTIDPPSLLEASLACEAWFERTALETMLESRVIHRPYRHNPLRTCP